MSLEPSALSPGAFASRHIGPGAAERQAMLDVIGVPSLDALVDEAIPPGIRLKEPLALPDGLSEHRYLRELRETASRNQVFRSYIGLGYYDCVTPSVILRNVLENPGWYTPYTPYQAEIAQGRLEALLNFQTMVPDLTGMEIANASLLDEATAAAEAMTMLHRACALRASARQAQLPKSLFFVADTCFRRRSTSCARAPSRWASSSSSAIQTAFSSPRECSARWCRRRTKPAACTICERSSAARTTPASSSLSPPICWR